MTLEVLFDNSPDNEFIPEAAYFGLSLNAPAPTKKEYRDIEKFFLKATYNLSNSRITEGFFCWLKVYGHLLSPSKIRRLISIGKDYNEAVFGAFIDFIMDECNNAHPFKILIPFSKKLKAETLLYSSPKISRPNKYFKKYNLVTHDYQLDLNKFLVPKTHTYSSCLELRNRALFGSTVNADVASYLSCNPKATAYRTSKETFHHKASVFKVFQDILEAA